MLVTTDSIVSQLGKHTKVITDEHVNIVLNKLQGSRYPLRDRVLFLLSVKANFRPREIANLNWDMLINDSNQIVDIITLYSRQGKPRIIQILPELKQALTEFAIERDAFKIREQPVIHSERNEALSAGAISVWFARLNHLGNLYPKTMVSLDEKTEEYLAGEIPTSYWARLERGARGRNIKFSITPDEAYRKFVDQNRKCNLSEVDLVFGKTQTASLDRIDSSKDYTSDNIQWVHKDLNRMKNKTNQSQFIAWCILVSKKFLSSDTASDVTGNDVILEQIKRLRRLVTSKDVEVTPIHSLIFDLLKVADQNRLKYFAR